MSNRMFRLGIPVMALVFGMTVIGCDKGGVLTLNDIPGDFHDRPISHVYIKIAGGNSTLRAGENDVDPENGEYTDARISKGIANIPLWNRSEDGSRERYSGSGTGSVEFAIILPPVISYKIEALPFSKGNAKLSFNDLKQ